MPWYICTPYPPDLELTKGFGKFPILFFCCTDCNNGVNFSDHLQYVWEQAEFDIIQRKTRISLHFHFQKQQKKLRHAFSYSWRL